MQVIVVSDRRRLTEKHFSADYSIKGIKIAILILILIIGKWE